VLFFITYNHVNQASIKNDLIRYKKIIPSNSNNVNNNDGNNNDSNNSKNIPSSLSFVCPYFYAEQCKGGAPSSDSVDDVCFVSIEDIKKLVDPVVIIDNTIPESNDSIVLENESNTKACKIITNQDIEKLEQWLIEFLTIDTYNKEIDDRLINASTKGIDIYTYITTHFYYILRY
jgi:hypothetical protein